MPPEQVKAFYAHVWPIFWPVLWWNLIVYRAWRAELRERGHDGNVCLAVARWGQLVITYVEPPRPDVPAYQGLSDRYAAHMARLSPDVGCIEPREMHRPLFWHAPPVHIGLRPQCTLPVPFLDSS